MAGKFGAFLRRMKVEKDLRLRPVAQKAGISLTYLSDLSHGRRIPPDKEKLDLLAEAMKLTRAERCEMYDAAAQDRGKVSLDLTEYIMDPSMPSLRAFLRKAQSIGADDDFWQRLTDRCHISGLF